MQETRLDSRGGANIISKYFYSPKREGSPLKSRTANAQPEMTISAFLQSEQASTINSIHMKNVPD